MASMRLVLPSPLPPDMQFTFDENESSAKLMFLKSWTTIFLSTAIPADSYIPANIVIFPVIRHFRHIGHHESQFV